VDVVGNFLAPEQCVNDLRLDFSFDGTRFAFGGD
jgi:hypothetical protein